MSSEIRVQTLNHLGIIAGLIDEIGLVEQIDQLLVQVGGNKQTILVGE